MKTTFTTLFKETNWIFYRKILYSFLICILAGNSLFSQNVTFVTPNASTIWDIGSTVSVQINNNTGGSIYANSLTFRINTEYIYSHNIYQTVGTGILTFEVSLDTNYLLPSSNYTIDFDYNTNNYQSITSQEFTINGIKVLNPNYSSYWMTNNTYDVTWFSHSVSSVNIDYSVNGGETWTSLATALSSTNGQNTYSWAIPTNLFDTIFGNSLVKVSQVGGAYSSTSAPFVLADRSFLEFIQPNSSTVWQLGHDEHVQFFCNVDSISYLNMTFLADGNFVWETTRYQTTYYGENDILFTIDPEHFGPSTHYSVILSYYDSTSTERQIQSQEFTIEGIRVTSPNSTSYWQHGQTYPITWVLNSPASINLDYSTNGGENWNSIATGIAATSGTNTYQWTISANTFDTIFSNSLVRVASAGNAVTGQSVHFTLSNVSRMEFIEPNSSSVWHIGGFETIKIKSNVDYDVDYANLSFYNNGTYVNSSYISLPAGVETEGQFFLNPQYFTPSTHYTMILTIYGDDVITLTSEQFQVIESPTPITAITSPLNNSHWYNGDDEWIQWYSYGVSNVKLEYSINNGETWNLIAGNQSANSGSNSFYWNIAIPGLTPGEQYYSKIRISNAANPSEFAVSPTFIIEEYVPSITSVTNPHTGSWWNNGNSFQIKWISNRVPYVNIDYSIDGGDTWTVIANDIPSPNNNGYYNDYTWSIPANKFNDIYSNSRIRVTASGGTATAQSVQFTLADVAPLNILTPNAETTWETGTTISVELENISSGNLGISSVLFMIGENQPQFTYLGQPCTPGVHSYTIFLNPALLNPSEYYYLRIYYSEEDNYMDRHIESDLFTIINPTLAISSIHKPDNSSYFDNYQIEEIQWYSYGVTNVKIEYSLNNGTTWTTIEDSYASSNNGLNTYQWELNIPGLTYGDHNAIMRISDVTNPEISKVSEQFHISEPYPGITSIISPNYNSVWYNGMEATIRWRSYSISTVNIEYSTSYNGEWINIASNVNSSNNGENAYVWNIPDNEFNDVYNQSRIRISATNYNSNYTSYSFTFLNFALCLSCPDYNQELNYTNSWQTVPGTVPGTVVSGGCIKYRFDVVEGDTYIMQTGCGNGASSDFYSNMSLFSESCQELTSDYGSCGMGSKIVWTATYTGYAYLEVRGLGSYSVGDFVLAYTCQPVGNYLFVSAQHISIPWTGNTSATLGILSNVSWSASTTQNWLTATPSTGSNNGNVVLNATINNEQNTRVDTLRVTNGVLTKTVVVTQESQTSIANLNQSRVRVYPNPVSDNLTIEFGDSKSKTITVRDVSGKAVMEKESSDNRIVFDCSGLANGLYIIQIRTENELGCVKFIKQ